MDSVTVESYKDFVEIGTSEIQKKIPRNVKVENFSFNDFLNELYDFRECETDYLVVLAEQFYQRVAVAISNKTNSLVFVYKVEDFYIVFYQNSSMWKWEITANIDEAIDFISKNEN